MIFEGRRLCVIVVWVIFIRTATVNFCRSVPAHMHVNVSESQSTGQNGAVPMSKTANVSHLICPIKRRLSMCQNGCRPQVKMALSPCQNGECLRITLFTYKCACPCVKNGRRPQVKMAAVPVSKWPPSMCQTGSRPRVKNGA